MTHHRRLTGAAVASGALFGAMPAAAQPAPSAPAAQPSPTAQPAQPAPPGSPTAAANRSAIWSAGTLVFQTGFGGTTAIATQPNGTERMSGRDDAVTHSDFGADLATVGSGQPLINYTGGTVKQRQATIATDPNDPANRTLHFVLREPYAASEGERKARVQLELYGLTPGFREFRQSVRVYLGAGFKQVEVYPGAVNWLTLAEYWNNEWWDPAEKHGFRITVGIGKADSKTQPLNLFVAAEDQGQIGVWKVSKPDATVPIGQWFTLETYYREGDRDTGRFALAITPDGGARRVLYDGRGFTQNTHDPAPNGVTGFNPMKLYTSAALVDFVRSKGAALEVDYDDYKLWKVR